jgi:hypothetical protein
MPNLSALIFSLSLAAALPPDAILAPRDLWRLALASLTEHGVPCQRFLAAGDDAFLALHGERTAQVAQLADDQLVTVNVTPPHGDCSWAIASARSVAMLPRAVWRQTPISGRRTLPARSSGRTEPGR